MHTTAHPDDEHGGMLALASRGMGARVSLLTLNRGESGDNALGPQLFDGLGLIRTEELAVADRYYGVDRQYFTSVVDYGFSKRLEEAFDKWGRENVLRDVVRIIRTERPLVIVSRFQGNQRDGHGNHQTAGLLTQQAFEAAANPAMFPEQIKAGLRPWQAKKLYIGGMREDEDWTVRVDTGQYSPWLGDSFDNFARTGLSFQRSQNSGRLTLTSGPELRLLQAGRARGAGQRQGAGLLRRHRLPRSPGCSRRSVGPNPPRPAPCSSRSTPPCRKRCARSTGATRRRSCRSSPAGSPPPARPATSWLSDPDAALILSRKVDQFQSAINTALGLDLTAIAQPANLPEPTGPGAAFAPPPVMGAVVPGQSFEVRVQMSNRGGVSILPESIALDTDRGWQAQEIAPGARQARSAAARCSAGSLPSPWPPIPPSARDPTSPARPSRIRSIASPTRRSSAARPPSAPAEAVVRYRVDDVPVEVRAIVRRREAKLPYGFVMRELRVVPAVSLTVAPDDRGRAAGGRDQARRHQRGPAEQSRYREQGDASTLRVPRRLDGRSRHRRRSRSRGPASARRSASR